MTDAKPNAYDQVPYRSASCYRSQPVVLATFGRLFGMSPASPESCRVLELGGSDGGNLLPLASSYPNSSFVGIDLSARQIAMGQDRIRELGIKNFELRQLSILDVDENLGKFDFIIAHGVWSWVPAPVRDKIFQICRTNLQPQGVAYVSYNTYPGWRMRGIVRDMMFFHARNVTDPAQRLKRAKEVLRFVANSSPKERPYGQFMQAELEMVEQSAEYYLFHDHLETDNAAVYFHEFIQMARDHGLQYLCEAQISSVIAGRFGPDAEATLRRFSSNVIDLEQYLDFLHNRMFRQTLLCQQEIPVKRKVDATAVTNMYIGSRFRPVKPVDLSDPQPTVFSTEKIDFKATDPLMKAAMQHLASIAPRAEVFETLVDKAIGDAGSAWSGTRQQAVDLLGNHLLAAMAGEGVQFSTMPPCYTVDPGPMPMANPVARHEAKLAHAVTNQRHESISLTPAQCRVLALLDGTRHREQILEALQASAPDEWKGKSPADLDAVLTVFGHACLMIQ